MADECDDVLVAYPPVASPRARRLAALPPTVRVTVALDSEQAATELARAARDARREVGVYVELDLGMRRVGVRERRCRRGARAARIGDRRAALRRDSRSIRVTSANR